MSEGQIDKEPRRSWARKDDDNAMACYLAMSGRVTLAELIQHFADNYPHVDPTQLNLNWVTATWEEPPTAADLAQREAWRASQTERTERWERETYDRLKAKFDGGGHE